MKRAWGMMALKIRTKQGRNQPTQKHPPATFRLSVNQSTAWHAQGMTPLILPPLPLQHQQNQPTKRTAFNTKHSDLAILSVMSTISFDWGGGGGGGPSSMICSGCVVVCVRV